MKMVYGRYEYDEALSAALENPSFHNLEELAKWLDVYDPSAWNGEYYDLDEGRRLFPVYGDEDENGCFPVVGYDIR